MQSIKQDDGSQIQPYLQSEPLGQEVTLNK